MHVKDNLVKVMRVNGVDYISLTDLASYINPNDPSGVIRNWMSTRNSFSFYSLWEELSNPDFNSVKYREGVFVGYRYYDTKQMEKRV